VTAPEEQSLDPVGPLLTGRQIMSQDWVDLTFLHWRVDPALVAPMMPRGVRPDVVDGSTWVGLVPFTIHRASIGRGPAVPWLGTFPETNVRLYSIDSRGRRGVVFRSLEASRLAVVLGARAVFALPYMWAQMSITRSVVDDLELDYRTTRRFPGRGARRARSRSGRWTRGRPGRRPDPRPVTAATVPHLPLGAAHLPVRAHVLRA